MLTQTTTSSATSKWLQKIERCHPFELLLTLSMFGSMLIFTFLLWSWQYSIARSSLSIQFPSLLLSNSLILAPATVLTFFFSRAYKNEQLKTFQWLASSIALLHTSFLALQISSWEFLSQEGHLFTQHAATGYLYILSGLHLVHLVGALVMLLFLYKKLEWARENPVHALMYGTDPFEQLRVKLIKRYLRFVDIAWLSILLFMWWHFY